MVSYRRDRYVKSLNIEEKWALLEEKDMRFRFVHLVMFPPKTLCNNLLVSIQVRM